VIFGGAGFVGSNLAHQLLTQTDAKVRIYDNLSRPGVKANLGWLERVAGRSRRLDIVVGDVRDASKVHRVVSDATEIYHFAAQVAVTTSLVDPRHDFEVNLAGTFNVLEAARQSGNKPFMLFTSTNKVYGDMNDRKTVKLDNRYAYAYDVHGIDEQQQLDFHSPYGCSKGAADQYVRDYARVFGIPATVFRMSCIAGQRQFGNEDQGWVAHFLYSALARRPLTIYGDGCQVRDVLYVGDLVRAFEAARLHSAATAGEIYNIGGGRHNTTSLLELIGEIEQLTRRKVKFNFDEARPGDQVIYVSDTRKFTTDTGWQPTTTVAETLQAIYQFWRENRAAIEEISGPVMLPEERTATPVPIGLATMERTA
jgi:CDP-paratose 2-epimerase